ncbi:class I SAM-dependent methyltransferase [Patescibacteria group bacterium]|nr:class I SAM-dependent methyltransferase [Patescibacteria group bacterium]
MVVDRIDYEYPQAKMYHDQRSGFFKRLRLPFWTQFYEAHTQTIFKKGGKIVDIGGGFRIDSARGNRINQDHVKKFGHFLSNPNVDYIVTDYTDKYSPDSVEDIHALSFESDSIDAIFCIAILEHVYDPQKATSELVRVLKKGGSALLYVPFIYRYHAHSKDYKDYYRYTKDGISYLFRECSSVEICPVRGIFESLLRFFPFTNFAPLRVIMRSLDIFIPAIQRISETQTSGYHIFITK